MKQPFNILLIGVLQTGNLGDDLIFQIVENTCIKATHTNPCVLNIGSKKNLSDDEVAKRNRIIDTLRKGFKSTPIYQTILLSKRKQELQNMLDEVNFTSISMIVFPGGQLFYNYFVPLIEIIVERAEKENVEVVFNACGIGLLNALNRNKLIKILKSDCVKHVTVRENANYLIGVLSGASGLPDIKQVYDPALDICRLPNVRHTRQNVVGFAPISPIMLKKRNIHLSYSEYIDSIKLIIEVIEKEGLTCELFSTGDRGDYAFIRSLKHEGINNSVIQRPKTTGEIIQLIRDYRSIVSFRLHSHIIAAANGVSSFGLIWDDKVKDFLENIDRGEDSFSIATFSKKRLELKSELSRFLKQPYTANIHKFPSACDDLQDYICQKLS